MRFEEAVWIGQRLAQMDLKTVLELGSSTLEFRTRDKPHIETHLHAPLRARGVRIVCADLKGGDGIDISGDIFDGAIQEQLRAVQPDVVLCCNILEHVTDAAVFAGICESLAPPGGRLIVTVPQSYPYHPDPIDTYFRPDPEEVAALFLNCDLEAAATLPSSTYGEELNGAADLLRVLARVVAFRGGAGATRARAHRLLWLGRPYLSSAVILRAR